MPEPLPLLPSEDDHTESSTPLPVQSAGWTLVLGGLVLLLLVSGAFLG